MSVRTVRLGGMVAALTLGATLTTAPALAVEVDPQAPVVVDDQVTLWPGEQTEIDVLANDSDPGGDDLAPCRVPSILGPDGDYLPVQVWDRSWIDERVGVLQVATALDAEGVHVIDYYVCNHTRLTLARLTVNVRPVQPVDVVPGGAPGRIRVTNHNDRRIVFIATDASGCLTEVHAPVPAGVTRSFQVRRHTLPWFARIGSGIADHGTLRHLKLDGPPGPPPPPYTLCFPELDRQLPGIGASGS